MSFHHSFNPLLPLTPDDAPLAYQYVPTKQPQLALEREKYENPYVPYQIPTKTVQTTYTTFQTNYGVSSPPLMTTVYSQRVLYYPAAPPPFFPVLQPSTGSTDPHMSVDQHQIGNERKLRAKERKKSVRFNPIERQPSPPSIGRLDKRRYKNQEVCKWLSNHMQDVNGIDFSLHDVEAPSTYLQSLEL